MTFSNEKPAPLCRACGWPPYSGQFFQKAPDLDVEHMAPLAWVHKRGGANWSREQRPTSAEDPAILWLIEGDHNLRKGNKGPDEWLPPYQPATSIYVK
ncbi:HNH endonuclease [Microbulbifer variabilis]|uniref:HNH endonuclease n=1 Tax=Microbulbifer variabilis TaxID=266805 RepID=UPI001CFF04BE|nr:HNH endonuclease [Microbulbifer variabilis]